MLYILNYFLFPNNAIFIRKISLYASKFQSPKFLTDMKFITVAFNMYQTGARCMQYPSLQKWTIKVIFS